MSPKTRELGIFTIGIGIVLGILTCWLTFAMRPDPGREPSAGLVAVPLVVSGVYIVMGILTLSFKSRTIIQATVALVVLGFVVDLLLGFNVIKAAISALIISLILKTGREALNELRTAR